MIRGRSVFILCAGEARRFEGTKKQLLQVGNYTILERIIKQCKVRDHKPIVVTHDTEITRHAFDYGANVIVPSARSVTCETLMSMYDFYGDNTSVLLGDTVYSPDCISKILGCNAPFKTYGNSFEIFGLSFSYNVVDKVTEAAIKAKNFQLGKLRYLYKAYMGLDMDCKEIEGKPPADNFVFISDWTNDVDMEIEYRNILREVVGRGLLKNA